MRAARGSSFPRRAERGTARAAAPLARPAGAAAWEESPCRRGAAPGVGALGQRPVPVSRIPTSAGRPARTATPISSTGCSTTTSSTCAQAWTSRSRRSEVLDSLRTAGSW